jgi:hypothetical protein
MFRVQPVTILTELIMLSTSTALLCDFSIINNIVYKSLSLCYLISSIIIIIIEFYNASGV